MLEQLTGFFEAVVVELGLDPGDQLSAYRDHSVGFVLVEAAEVVGGLELVLGNLGGHLPVRSVWPELACADCLNVADVAFLALAPHYRGNRSAFWLLCTELWRFCIVHAIQVLWFEAPPTILRLYRVLGWPLVVEGPARLHWGEPTYPCSMQMEELTEVFIQKAKERPAFRKIVQQALRDPVPEAAAVIPELLALR